MTASLRSSNLEEFIDRVKKEVAFKKRTRRGRIQHKIGQIREKKVEEALRLLKKERIICDFLRTTPLSYVDLIEGIDFYVVRVKRDKYHVGYLSVTGKSWLKKHREKHPEIPVIGIDCRESQESVKQKVLKILNSEPS